MMSFVDQAKLELELLVLGKIGRANLGSSPTFWDHLASQATPKPASSPRGAIIDTNFARHSLVQSRR
jgi:hypothetical protein